MPNELITFPSAGASCGWVPRDNKPGNKDPDRRTIAAVEAMIAARRRFRDGSKPRNRSDSHIVALISLVTEIEDGCRKRFDEGVSLQFGTTVPSCAPEVGE